MTDCRSPEHAAGAADAACCTAVVTDCAQPDSVPPVAQLAQDPPTPTALLVAVLPLDPVVAGVPAEHRHARYLARIPNPPRGLRNAILLI